MNDRIEPEDLAGYEGLPPEDPRARALDSQPRARAQQRAYREFVAPGEFPAETAAAEDHLQHALEREIGVSLGESPAPGVKPAARGAEPREAGGFLGWLLAPALRPALATVLIVIAGGWFYASVLRRPSEPVMRGPAVELREGELVVAPSPEQLADGSLRLNWTAMADAESYAVVFLSPELSEVARIRDLYETHLDLKPGFLPRGVREADQVLYRVVAMRGRDEIGRSRTVAVTLPE